MRIDYKAILEFIVKDVDDPGKIDLLTSADRRLLGRVSEVECAHEVSEILGISFRRLYDNRRRTVNRLLLSKVLQEPKDNSKKIEDVYREVHKAVLIVNLLELNEQRDIAFQVAGLFYPVAERYYLIESCIKLSRHLAHTYALKGNKSKARKYYSRTSHFTEELMRVAFCDDVYGTLILDNKHDSKMVPDGKLHTLHAYARLAGPNNYRFFYPYYLIIYNDAILKKNYIEASSTCSKAIQHFETLPFEYTSSIASFKSKLAYCYQIASSDKKAQKLLTEIADGHLRPSVYALKCQQQISLCAKEGEYSEALRLCVELLDYCKNHSIETGIEEQLLMYRIHFRIVLGLGLGQLKYLEQRIPQRYMKGELGAVGIIVAILYYTFEDGNTSYLEGNFDRLERYVTTNLRRQKSRTKYFMRLLLVLPRLKYQIIQYDRMAQKYYRQLTKLPQSESCDQDDMEIIPYEDLWHLICQRVGTPYKNRLEPNNASSQAVMK